MSHKLNYLINYNNIDFLSVPIARKKQVLCLVRTAPVTNGEFCQLQEGSSYRLDCALSPTPDSCVEDLIPSTSEGDYI